MRSMPTNATPKTAAPMKSVAHDDDEALAAAIVDEALQGLENLLSPDAMERVRQELVDALLIDPTGSRLLRRAKADALSLIHI